MAKRGFSGQWIEVAKVGKAIDSKGIERDLTLALLSEIVANFNASGLETPLTVGHPKNGAPAFGWISELKIDGDRMLMLTEDTDDEFEQMVKDGRLRTRSAGIWLNHPTMKAPTIDHVAFLGAEPPAVKGLKKIQFSESAEGESFALESTINLQENEMGLKDEDIDQLPASFWEKFKVKLGIDQKTELKEGGDPAPATVKLSEDMVKGLIAEAVTATKAEFKEQIDTLTTENENLKAKVDGQIAGSTRSEILSFVESIPAEKGKHYLKRAGVVEFMEGLAAADAAAGDKKIVAFSEGEGDDRAEHKFSLVEWFKTYVDAQPAFVQFGEKFGSLTASPDADKMVDPAELNKMRDAMGIKNKAAGGDK